MINKARKLSTKFRPMVNSFFPKRPLKDAIRQKHCYLCDSTIYRAIPICIACESDLPFNRNSCNTCAIPLAALIGSKGREQIENLTCGECLKYSPSYSRCISLFCYEFPVNALISDFKYNAKRHLGKLMATMLAHKIKTQIDEKQLLKPDKLIPVPLHVDKFEVRGFNQAEDISTDLSQYLGIPTDPYCIQRVINTPAQVSLTKHQRQHNLSRAFYVQKRIEGEVVALVDDVITTGATAELLSSLLLKAGAKEVYVWSLARTPLAH